MSIGSSLSGVLGQVEEECGFRVAPDALQLVTGYRSSVGTSGSHHTLFFAEVCSMSSVCLRPTLFLDVSKSALFNCQVEG